MINLAARQLTLKTSEKMLCQNLDVSFGNGQTWAILGSNGSGKSTLLQTLAGLESPAAGEVYLGEKPLYSYPKQHLAKIIAILFQNYDDPFPNTVLETVLIGRHPHLRAWLWESLEDRLIAQEALKIMDLVGTEAKMVTHLSGGERRRVAIATVIAQTPNIYLLDEPINQLDLRHQIQVLKYFQSLQSQQKLIITVMHDINLVTRFCSHALMLLGDGNYLAGTVTELFQPRILSRLYQQEIKRLETEKGTFWLYG